MVSVFIVAFSVVDVVIVVVVGVGLWVNRSADVGTLMGL